jgi:hypothetical protein
MSKVTATDRSIALSRMRPTFMEGRSGTRPRMARSTGGGCAAITPSRRVIKRKESANERQGLCSALGNLRRNRVRAQELKQRLPFTVLKPSLTTKPRARH